MGSPRPISENPRYREAAEKLARFQNELRALRQAIDATNATWYAKQARSADEDVIALADRMIDGQPLTADDRDTATKLRELERKTEVIRPAIARQKEAIDLIRGELSVDAGKMVQARHRKALAGIWDAARQLAAAAAAEREIRRQLLDDGYEALDAFTPAPRFGIPLAMGDENCCDTALWHYKRQLEGLGIET